MDDQGDINSKANFTDKHKDAAIKTSAFGSVKHRKIMPRMITSVLDNDGEKIENNYYAPYYASIFSFLPASLFITKEEVEEGENIESDKREDA